MMKILNEEESQEGEGSGKKGWRLCGPIILLFNPLNVETHQSGTTCSNDSWTAFI